MIGFPVCNAELVLASARNGLKFGRFLKPAKYEKGKSLVQAVLNYLIFESLMVLVLLSLSNGMREVLIIKSPVFA